MEEIIPGLWIGDLACALATDYLSLAGVTHIVTAMKQTLPSPILLPDGRSIDADHMYHVNIDDIDSAPILVHLPGAIDFINEAIDQQWLEDDDEDSDASETEKEDKQEGSSSLVIGADRRPEGRRKGQWATLGSGTVLVHCQAGVSRSVAIVIAYLMRMRSISFSTALQLVQSRRSQADPNPGFRHQLELFESSSYNVDVRNQRIRRFLMSQASILKGDPIDDVMLSYYPSPLHSPAPSSSSSSVNNSVAGLGASLQISQLREDGEEGTSSATGARTRNSRSSSSAGEDGNPNSGRSSSCMSRQGSRAAAAAAAASESAIRRRRDSRSDGSSALDLSKSPPMPANAPILFDAADEEQEDKEDDSRRLIREQFSSVKEDHEVLITISKGNLPGGVSRVKGNQGKANGDTRLPKPHFQGLKLRCRVCRWELAARDHVVEHEAGRGKDAFDVRKREKDVNAKNKDARTTRELGIEQRFGAQARVSLHSDREDGEGQQKQEQEQVDVATPTIHNGIKTATSLSAQLPPHLAALRQGRAGQTATSSQGSGREGFQRRMLHSSQCSAYFVEPLAWMSAIKLGEIAGRLDCPNSRCAAKLGSWDWAGMQCACGAWVTPAFALHKSKVDEI